MRSAYVEMRSHNPFTSTPRSRLPNAPRKALTFLPTSLILLIFERSAHCRARRYIRKSKTEIVLARMRSRYGFFVTDKRGVESSFGAGEMRLPNHDKFFSRRTWKNDASSSSYWIKASWKRFTPSKELARLSYWGHMSRKITQRHKIHLRALMMKKVQKFHPGIALWLSDRFTSSSLWEMAESKADSRPSLSFAIVSPQVAGLFWPLDHANWTHLWRRIVSG